ncbi:MAG: cysteine desulfurase family protein [Chlamydiae bacterium]|nr:cysteine desulfurase family protein [Chlamydiota bacterium]
MYFDNNATTALDPLVLEAMNKEFAKGPSNPSSVHSWGQAAKGRLALARQEVAAYFDVLPQEVIFTSGGTESLNHAIFGLGKDKRILSSDMEHPAVLEPLKKMGSVKILKGLITLETLLPHLEGIDLMVFMAANNETGVKSPLKEIADIGLARGIPLIVDGVAIVGREALKLHKGITAFAFSAHKFHGPKGTGCLIIRKNIAPQMLGGSQENKRRAGTENLPGIIGLTKALSLIPDPIYVEGLRNYFESLLVGESVYINGDGPRVCNVSNLFFKGVDGEALLFYLDQNGISCSHGSACSSGSLAVSHVLLALGLGLQRAKSSLRFSFSRYNTPKEVMNAAEIIKEAIKKLIR